MGIGPIVVSFGFFMSVVSVMNAARNHKKYQSAASQFAFGFACFGMGVATAMLAVSLYMLL